MAEELKPCPFCSCTDIGEVTINPRLEQRHRRFKVYCKVCQCRTSEHKTRKEARIYWSTRAQLPSQGGEAVELVELLRNKFPRIDPCKPVPLDEKAHCCEYTIYVERERLHRLIDAKLAGLEVKP